MGLTLAAGLALGGAAHAAAGKRLIVSPRSGDRISAHPVLIRVRVGEHARLFRAQLNGHPVAGYFSRTSSRGVRKLRVSPSYGLRHGKNRLHVRIRRANGKGRSRRSIFRVRRDGPLAAAGLNRRVAVGARVYLDAARSRSHRASPRALKARMKGANRFGLNSKWKVVGAPRGNPPGATEIAGARTSTPVLKPEYPGRYIVRLTVTAKDGKTGSDRVRITANAPPAVPINTIARAQGLNTSGIEVGESFYQAVHPSDNRVGWAQIVVLDRTTLEPVTGALSDLANKTYFCSEYPCTAVQQQIESDLQRLNSNHLVIVSSPITLDSASDTPIGLDEALGRIGVSPGGYNADQLRPGGISAIGVPGTDPGDGDWHVEAVPQLGAGRMTGYLVRNNQKYYTFAAPDRVQYDTQASGSNAQTSVIQLGDQRFLQPLSGFWGGFHVVIADPQTLQGQSYWFSTGTGDDRDGNLVAMNNVLTNANNAGNKLIVVASRGIPYVTNGSGPGFNQGDLNYNKAAIVDSLERAGGTRTAAFRALDPGMSKDTSYTLIGYSGAGGGNGVEGAVDHTPTSPVTSMSVAPLTGTMARTGPNYGFRPQAAPLVGAAASSPSSQPDTGAAATELTSLMLQPQSPWPEQDPKVFPDPDERARKEAAIKWIGETIFRTDDFRGQYYSQIFDKTDWPTIADKVQALGYQKTTEFTEADLTWAKRELAGPRTKPATAGGEIGWLINTNLYMQKIAAPFGQTQLQQWSAFEAIATAVQKEVGADDQDQVRAQEQGVLESIETALSSVTGTGLALAGTEIIYHVAQLFATDQNGTPSSEPFTVKASELGSELAGRLAGEQEWIAEKIPDVVAADYAKLKAVGSCTSVTADGWATCPFDHNDWQFSQDDKDAAAAALVPKMKVWAYGALLHARFNLYKLPPWWQTNVADPNQFYGRTFDAFYYPFQGEPQSATVAKPIYRNAPDYGHTIHDCGLTTACSSSGDSWQIFALGYLTGSGTIGDRWQMHYPLGPNNSQPTDVIFKPTSDGGLGADPESFYDHFWPQTSTLDRYPEQDTPTGWCVAGDETQCR